MLIFLGVVAYLSIAGVGGYLVGQALASRFGQKDWEVEDYMMAGLVGLLWPLGVLSIPVLLAKRVVERGSDG